MEASSPYREADNPRIVQKLAAKLSDTAKECKYR